MMVWPVWRVMFPNSTSGKVWDWADRQLRCPSSPDTSVLFCFLFQKDVDLTALTVFLEFPCIPCPVAWAGCLLRNLTSTSPLLVWTRELCSAHTSTALAWWNWVHLGISIFKFRSHCMLPLVIETPHKARKVGGTFCLQTLVFGSAVLVHLGHQSPQSHLPGWSSFVSSAHMRAAAVAWEAG